MMRTAVAGLLIAMAAMAAPTAVTFNKDVLPILQKHCQSCHRPGEVAPMSFLSFQEARPWAKAMKAAVLTQKMPPWFADPRYGHFANERKLTGAEIGTLAAWADNGAPEGNAKDRPAPVEFVEGWEIGKPDIVFEMPNEFHVPAQGTIDYQYILVKTNFKQDVWVQAAEVRPGNRAVVHHMRAIVRPPGSPFMNGVEPGIPTTEPRGPGLNLASGAGSGETDADILAKYNPGVEPQGFTGGAKFIPAGSDLVFDIHYTANGKAATDKSRIGIVLAKAPPQRRVFTSQALTNRQFVIPPGDGNVEVRAEVRVEEPVELVWLQPHMHLRGKDFQFRVVYPTGESEILLNVPRYDFNWQVGYDLAKPLLLPKGTVLESISHFDNSPNNLSNPDPKAEVRFGPQSWDEMSTGFFSVVVDAKADTAKLFRLLPLKH